MHGRLLQRPVRAFGFVVNDDIRGVWNNTIVVGTAIRANNPDPQLVGFNNANQYPGAKGAVSVADDGNLNFRKGDVITRAADVALRVRTALPQPVRRLRARARLVRLCSSRTTACRMATSPTATSRARSSTTATSTPRTSSTACELLDAYAYGNWDIDDSRLTARLGQQSINWGESLLYTGINAFNPLNFAALARPGVASTTR